MNNLDARSASTPATTVTGFLALHLLLALFWMAVMGWSGANLVVGAVIGLLAIAVGARSLGSARYLRSLGATVLLILVFFVELVRANIQLARDILRRTPRFAPAILHVEVGDLGPTGMLFLANLISLTPGSLIIDLAPSRDGLFIHTLYASDVDEARVSLLRYSGLLKAIAGVQPGSSAP